MDPKKKPGYSSFQCLRYLFRLAWQNQKIVLAIMLLEPLCQVGASAIKLFMAPKILEIVSASAPISELGLSIALFAISLFLLNTVSQHCLEWDYCNKNALLLKVNSFLDEKCCNTSYPNMDNAEFRKLYEEASPAAGNQHGAAVSFIWSNLSNLLQNIFGFILYLFIVGSLNPILSITVIAISAISYALNQWQSNLGYNQMEEMYTYIGQMNYLSQKAESAQFAKDIRIFGLQDWIRDIYRSSFAMFDSLAGKQQTVYFLVNALDVCLSFLRNGIAYWYLIAMAIKGNLSASEFLLYFTAFTGFSQWVSGLLSEFADLREECLKISYILEFLNFPEPFRVSGGIPIPKAEAFEIRLEHVTFSYPKAERPVLEDLNLTIRPGEKLAVVGLNGAGKTTLIKLICGFCDPQEGRVLLNGIDIREFNRREYYRLLSAVFQEDTFLDVTLRENVAQSEDADDHRVQFCLRQAGLEEMIAKLPNGLDTHVGHDVFLDGVELSGGQIQRLMLARALYKDGPILILDEPTAALDPIAEDYIYQKYNEMTAGKTSVFISHRLASTRFCDRILFLSDGKIAEEGTHEGLLRKQGEYAKLFEVQSRYYQEGGEFK